MSNRSSFVRWSVACMVLAGLVVFGGNTIAERVTLQEESNIRARAHRVAGEILQEAERGLSSTLLTLFRGSADPALRDAVRAFEQSGDYRAQLRMQASLQGLSEALNWPGEIDVRDNAGQVIASTSNTRLGADSPTYEWAQDMKRLPGTQLGHTQGKLHVRIPLQSGGDVLGALDYLVDPQSFEPALHTARAVLGTGESVRMQLRLDGDAGSRRLVRRNFGESARWLDGAVRAGAASTQFPLTARVELPRLPALQAGGFYRDVGVTAGMTLVGAAILFMLLHALSPYLQGMQLLRHIKPRASTTEDDLLALDATIEKDGHSPSERIAYDILATHHVLEEVLKEHTGELEKLYRVLNQEHRKRDEAESALKAAELRFREAVESCMEGVWEWSAEHGLQTWIAESFLVSLGLRRNEFGGGFQDLLAHMHDEDRNPCFAAFQQQVRFGSHFELEYRLRNRKGEWHWFLSRGRLVRERGKVLRVMGSIQDIQSRKRAELEVEQLVSELEQRAHRDGLTGLHNRTSFLEVAHKELKRADRSTQPLSLMMLDLDYFKRINDSYGHAVGDQVLEEFAAKLREQLRESDTCARIGGEEFVILLPETSNLQACKLAERLRERVAGGSIRVNGAQLVQFTCSIGVTRLLPGETLEVLMARADGLLYQAKHAGRNRVRSDCEEWTALSSTDT